VAAASAPDLDILTDPGADSESAAVSSGGGGHCVSSSTIQHIHAVGGAPAQRDEAAGTLHPILDGLPVPLILVDERGEVLFYNCAMRGKLPRSSCGTSLRSVLPEYHAALAGDLRTPRSVQVTRQVGGLTLHESLSLSRLPTGFCLTVHDQTELVEREAADAQSARLASLGFLLAGVCHEVANPLSAIHSMVQLLQSKRGVTQETLDRGLANIAANIVRVLAITRKLSDFSRVGTDRPVPVSVDEAVEEAAALLRHSSWGAAVGVEYSGMAQASVLARSGQLQQVIFNLLLNAAQAMQGIGRISAVTELDPAGNVTLTVRDEGPGIAPENMGRMFEAFFTTKPGGEGTGLGLAISFEIVHELGGTILASNNPGGGACFRVELPRHGGG
jgi:signal transduction histidine kinase